MYKNKKILAVIPARGGSKDIPDKNIKNLLGKPLIAWTIEEAKRSGYIDRLILSSESQDIINVAKEYGCEVPFVRPQELAGDEVLGTEPFIHAVKALEEKYDYALLLQCTSPLRTSADIDECIRYCIDNGARSCISVSPAKSHPHLMVEISANGNLKRLQADTENFLPRQKFSKIYEFNGAIYMVEAETLLKTGKLVHSDTRGFIMPEERSLDIDDLFDFQIAEALMSSRKNVKQEVPYES